MPLVLNMTTDYGDVDLTFLPAGGLEGFDGWDARAVDTEIAPALVVRVAALDDIIDSKHADDRPIDIAFGTSAVRQELQARCLDELVLDIVPVVLGDGERIFDDGPEFQPAAVEAGTSPLATHIVYEFTQSDSPESVIALCTWRGGDADL